MRPWPHGSPRTPWSRSTRWFLSRAGVPVDEETARQALIDHAGDLDPEQLRQPRIVLVARAFPPAVTAATVWLSEMGLDITLQKLQAYSVFDDAVVVTVSQLFPVADVEEFTVSPQRQRVQQAEDRRRSTRERSTVSKLVNARVIADNTPLTLRPTTEVTEDVRRAIDAWIADEPARGRARRLNDHRQPLLWEADGQRYRPTAIVSRVLMEGAGVQRSVRGPAWWILEDGRDLPAVAGTVPSRAFNWSGLHSVLTRIAAGRWTTYGDLASLIGTAPQPLGQHLISCLDCSNAWRVLGSDGRSRPNFFWGDPSDRRTQQDVLEAEGVTFADGVANKEQRLSHDEMAGLRTDLPEA